MVDIVFPERFDVPLIAPVVAVSYTHLVSELSKPYRSTNKRLLTIWDKVRNLQDDILEPLVQSKYTAKLDESIFEH